MHSVEDLIFRLHLFKHRPDGFHALSYSYFLMKFAMGMVDTFGVVFIFTLGETIPQGLWLMAIYLLTARSMVALLLVPIARLLNRIGYRRIMLVAMLAQAVKLYLFYWVSTGELIWLAPAAVMSAVYMGGFFLGFHGLFLDDGDKGRIGEQAGFLEMLGRSATIVSPFLGGLILASYGFPTLFMIGVGLMLAAIVPLLMMPHHKHSIRQVGYKEVWQAMRQNPRFSKSVLFWNIQNAVRDFFWPVYLFMALGGYAVFGLAYSIAMGASSITVYWAGKEYDKRRFHMMYPLITIFQAFLWVMRFVAQTPLGIVAADVAGRMASPGWWMKIRRYELGKGEKMDSVVFGMAHEYLTTFGKLIGLALGMGLLALSGYSYWVLMIPAVIGVLAAGWLVQEK